MTKNLTKNLTLKTKLIKRKDLEQLLNSEIKDKNKDLREENKLFSKRFSYRKDLINLSQSELKVYINELSRHKNYHPIPYAGNISSIFSFILNNNCLYFTDYINSLVNVRTTIESKKLINYIKYQCNRSDIQGKNGTIFLFLIDFYRLSLKYDEQSEILSFVNIGCLLQAMSLLASWKQYNSCIHFFIKDPKRIIYNNQTLFPVCIYRVGKNEKTKY